MIGVGLGYQCQMWSHASRLICKYSHCYSIQERSNKFEFDKMSWLIEMQSNRLKLNYVWSNDKDRNFCVNRQAQIKQNVPFETGRVQ